MILKSVTMCAALTPIRFEGFTDRAQPARARPGRNFASDGTGSKLKRP
jgi:hypothetical protein